jgi:hypothetical protein
MIEGLIKTEESNAGDTILDRQKRAKLTILVLQPSQGCQGFETRFGQNSVGIRPLSATFSGCSATFRPFFIHVLNMFTPWGSVLWVVLLRIWPNLKSGPGEIIFLQFLIFYYYCQEKV